MTSDASICGDGVVSGDEECDDGPDNDDNGLCRTTCVKAACYDGFVQPLLGEECDDGLANGEAAACTDECKLAVCGDGKIWAGVEECDDGAENKAGTYNGCTPMTCTKGPRCGDKIVQKPEEECDEGDAENGEDGEPCTTLCTLDGKVIFVTSTLYKGALGGLGGADDKCNTLAMVAQLANAGSFKAWLSDEQISVSERMIHHEEAYLLLDATEVAGSWADLTDGALAAKIVVDEYGIPFQKGPVVWTASSADGSAKPPACASWTKSTKGYFGWLGSSEAVDSGWSDALGAECSTEAALICVEQ